MTKQKNFKNELDRAMKKAPRDITYKVLADTIKVSRMHLWRLLNSSTLTTEQQEKILTKLSDK